MNLPTTTRGRLNLYRKRAGENKYGRNDWRTHKYGNTWGTPWHSGIRKDGLILTDDKDTLGEYLGDWTEVNGGARYLRDCTGFYVDSWCSETIRGGVVRLRGARFTLYIPATYCTGWDGATLYYKDAEQVDRGGTDDQHETAAFDAARTAYSRAEREADKAREESAKDQAEQDIEQERAEIHEINKAARALLAEIRGAEFTENVCAALRHRLHEYLADRRKCFRIIAERQENYWSAVA